MPDQRSNQKSVFTPEPILIEEPIRRTSSSWMIDCQNWEPPTLGAKASGWPRRYLLRMMWSQRLPSPVSIRHSHLDTMAMCILLDDITPSPPWYLGLSISDHLSIWYFFLLPFPAQRNGVGIWQSIDEGIHADYRIPLGTSKD